MSEATLQQSLKRTLQALSGWQEVTVVINDWHILDGSLDNAPYALIETADSFAALQDRMIPVINWQIPVTLLCRFTDWGETYNQMRDIRQAIINEIAANSEFSTCYLVNVVRSDTGIGEWYDPHQSSELDRMPIFITQRIILEIEESTGDGCGDCE
jgi:hypothetical protein